MSALPAREPAASRAVPGSIAAAQGAQIRAGAPQVTATIQRYLQRLAAFLAPASVNAAENALRQFARWMITDAGLDSIAAVRRDDIEDDKVWLTIQPRAAGQVITAETHRQRIRAVRAFFERIIEWDWPDAPPRNPVIAGDIPKKPEPLPRFLDDRDAAKLMAAARASTDPRDRLVVELLARTGMRAGELAGLDAGAVVLIGAGHWLRIPLGKLRNDRYVPLHPELAELVTAWTAANLEHIRRHKRLIADHRGPLGPLPHRPHRRPRRPRRWRPRRPPPPAAPAATNTPTPRASPPSPATPPATPAPPALTCTGSSSSSAPATATDCSASQRHDQHDRAYAPGS